MTNETMKAYAEIDCILSNMPEEYVSKVPRKLREKFKREKDFSYNFELVPTRHLKEQGLSKKTIALLAMLKYNYWCKDEEEKKKLLLMFKENEDKKQMELRKKYDIDNILKNKRKETKENDEMENNINLPIEINKENVFNKIIKFIKRIFHI